MPTKNTAALIDLLRDDGEGSGRNKHDGFSISVDIDKEERQNRE